jgi:hypothetical protein
MKPDIFIHYNSLIKQKSILTLKKAKSKLKSYKNALISSIETVLYYQSEIKLQLKVFRVNARNNDLNRF